SCRAGGIADDRGTWPIGKPAVAALRRPVVAMAAVRVAGSRPRRGRRHARSGAATMTALPVTIGDIRDAAAAIEGATAHTPTIRAAVLAELAGVGLVDARRAAGALARERGLIPVHPYDDPAVIAGQGTIALEMLADEPELDTLIVPVGGGGLISGIAVAAKAMKSEIEILG